MFFFFLYSIPILFQRFFSISVPKAIFYIIVNCFQEKSPLMILVKVCCLKKSHNLVFLGFSLTSSRSVHLAQVPRRRHGRHDQIEWDGNVHGAHRVRPSPDHANLIMCLEVHIRWTSCKDRQGVTNHIYFPHKINISNAGSS